jgi:hypothetical protein
MHCVLFGFESRLVGLNYNNMAQIFFSNSDISFEANLFLTCTYNGKDVVLVNKDSDELSFDKIVYLYKDIFVGKMFLCYKDGKEYLYNGLIKKT